MNVDEGRDGAGTCTCGGKDETTHGGKEGKEKDECDSALGEDVKNETDELLVVSGDSTTFNDAGCSFFAIVDNVGLVFG